MRSHVVLKICSCILSEMRAISSIHHDSVLKNSDEGLKKFSWEAVHEELTKHVPTLMMILSQLIPKATEHKPLQCLIASQLLKCRHPKMGLVQQAVSVMLYGNSVAKQVTMHVQFEYSDIQFAAGVCKSLANECVLDISGNCKCCEENK